MHYPSRPPPTHPFVGRRAVSHPSLVAAPGAMQARAVQLTHPLQQVAGHQPFKARLAALLPADANAPPSPAGEKGRRIRELTSVVQKRFKFPDGSVELYAEKVNNRGLCAIAQAESLRYKLLGGLAVRRCAPRSPALLCMRPCEPHASVCSSRRWHMSRCPCGSVSYAASPMVGSSLRPIYFSKQNPS